MSVRPSQQPSPEALRIAETDSRFDQRWEAFVASHPEGLIYHHPLWLQALEREYGGRSLVLICEDAAGEIRGILPLHETLGLPFDVGRQVTRRRLASLPRTPMAGPLALDAPATVALVRAAVNRVRKEPGLRLQLKLWSNHLDGLLDDVVGSPWRPSYLLELPEDPGQLRFGSPKNHLRIRSQVNKVARLGVRVRPAESEGELRAWYRLYLDTMREHAVLPRPYRFFRALWELLRPRGLMRMLLAEQVEGAEVRLLAGSIFLPFGRTFVYAFNGRSRDALPLAPNDAIQWQAIHDACSEGFRRYDMGEVADGNRGLAHFKSKWGTQPREMYRYYCPPHRESGAHSGDGPGLLRRLMAPVWRRLPLSATVLLGDRIYRYL